MSVNLIAKEQYSEQLFVQCECGDEVIEFVRNEDEKEGVDYVILPHLQSANSKDTNPTFCFQSKGEFSDFLETFRNAKNDIDVREVGIFFDKYLTYKDKEPGVLVCGYSYDDKVVAIKKYATPKIAQKITACSWELYLTRDDAIKVLDVLENWR